MTSFTFEDIQIAKVVGENEDGITLFVPKDLQGTFHLSENDAFLSLIFCKSDGNGGVVFWVPWKDSV